jgi:hypothetical protein
VYLDLVPIGKTPLALPLARREGALIDLELDGYRKAHRQAAQAGAVAVALARDERVPGLVDRVRAAAGDAPEALVAELGRRVGAARVVVARRAPNGRVEARVLDVASARWVRPAQTFTDGDAAAGLVQYASLAAPLSSAGAQAAQAGAQGATKKGAPSATAKAEAKPVPAWKRWYTWVAGGVLVALVVALVVADHVGSDQLTIDAKH